MREQLAFTMGSNEVVVSHAHGVDCQEVFSHTPSRDTPRWNTGTLPEGALLDNFPGTEAERKEAERIFREFAVFSHKGEELDCMTTVHHRTTLKMTFQSISDTDESHPISLRR